MNLTSLLLNVVFCIVSLVQFVIITEDVFTSTELYTETRIVSLTSQEFPLRVSVCVSPGYKKDVLEEAGYEDYNEYQRGYSLYNDSVLGWAGHTQDGHQKYVDASTLQKNMTLWKNLSDLVEEFGVLENNIWKQISNGEEINNLVEQSRHYYDNFCFTLRTDILSFGSGLFVSFQEKLDIDEAELRFDDSNLFSGRQLLQNNINHLGGIKTITYAKNSTKSPSITFGMEIKQDVYDEKDLTKSCSIYPNTQFNSYKECDQQFGIYKLSSIFGSNVTPLWSTDNISHVTAGPISSNNQEFRSVHYNLLSGIMLSDCKQPCTITKTNTFSNGQQDTPKSEMIVIFNDKMPVTTTNLVPFSLTAYLSNLGGILGLWLGLGMVQLAELLLPAVTVQCKGCGKNTT